MERAIPLKTSVEAEDDTVRFTITTELQDFVVVMRPDDAQVFAEALLRAAQEL